MKTWFGATLVPLILGSGLAIGLPGAAAGAGPNAPASKPGGPAVSRQSTDQLNVVDCLLPAQIRKLGSNLTFLGPRRAVKTSARDCEIRGGEYVS
jgi:hypothetical protein